MSNLQDRSSSSGNLVRRTMSRSIARRAAEWPPSRIAAMATELKDALAREASLLRGKDDMLQQQALLAQEFEHRLINSLQLVVSLLSMQSRKAESPEAVEQLMIAARRVGAFERVHRQLHRLDHLAAVELKQFVVQLCEDISDMVLDSDTPEPIVVEGVQIEISSALGVPLGFIVNELITNAAKHGEGKITVRLETTTEFGHCLSVSNGGPGLPDGLHPGSSKRLGLRIIQALVRQINGRLQVGPGPGDQGACFKVFFPSTAAA
jgi:two-component sensor histidine kinase